jgi:hypothetical protein
MEKRIRTLRPSLVECNVDEGEFAGSCRRPEKRRGRRIQPPVEKELALKQAWVSSCTPWRRSSIYSDLGVCRCPQTTSEAQPEPSSGFAGGWAPASGDVGARLLGWRKEVDG